MQATDIDDVFAKLTSIIETHRGSPMAFFPAVYRATTARVRAAIRRNEFSDGARMGRFVTTFANRYFAALDALAATGGEPPARSWQLAFDAALRPHTMILQHVLVGMNAHINYDLPLSVIEVANGADIATIKPDFDAINDILAALLNPVQQVIDDFSPLLRILDKVGGRTDEELVTFSIRTARAEAWHEATRLAQEAPEQRQRSSLSLDRRVSLLGSSILVPDGPLGLATALIARTESTNIEQVTRAMLAMN